MDSWIHELDCYTVSSAPGWSLDIGPPGPPASPLWYPMCLSRTLPRALAFQQLDSGLWGCLLGDE